MNQPAQSTAKSRTIITTLKRRWWLWILPTIVATLATIYYAKVRQAQWRASQALLVRDEAGAETDRQGRFVSMEAMKTSQETIREVARNHTVVSSALRELGAPSNHDAPQDWPSNRDVEAAQKQIRVDASAGAEFGHTEVIHLSVNAGDRERAVEFCQILCDQLDERLRRLRMDKAVSVIAELERSAAIAQNDLEQATQRLRTLEREVGSDLGELRILTDSGAGESNLRSSLNQLETELREADTRLRSQRQQQKLLMAAADDPQKLVATPAHLLDSQPAIRRLKEGLVDAQLRTAQLVSTLNRDHPKMQAALTTEDEIRREMYAELDLAIPALAADIEVSESRIGSLQQQLADVRGRLDQLADLRANYGNLVAEVRQRTGIVETTRVDLVEAQASQSAAQTTSLLTRVDAPRVGDFPVGPSRKIIVLGGFLGGLMIGLGLVFLVVPLGEQVSRAGRRLTDRMRQSAGRRASDASQATGRALRGGDRAEDMPVVERRGGDRYPAGPAAGATPDRDPLRRRATDWVDRRTPADKCLEAPSTDPDHRCESLALPGPLSETDTSGNGTPPPTINWNPGPLTPPV